MIELAGPTFMVVFLLCGAAAIVEAAGWECVQIRATWYWSDGRGASTWGKAGDPRDAIAALRSYLGDSEPEPVRVTIERFSPVAKAANNDRR